MTKRHTIQLRACLVEPLASYLKSIGIARLVSEQADPTLRIWFDECAHLDTTLSADELLDFLVGSYCPTPIINPMNNGSGFGEAGARKSAARKALSAIRSSEDARLHDYRVSIQVALELLERPDWGDLKKEEQAGVLRSRLPDSALDWLDASIVLTSTSRSFPPLLGTGGNDGRLDFSSTFMQRIGELFGLADKPLAEADVRALASDALFGTRSAKLLAYSLGQFDPYAAGGPRSGPTGKAKSLANPWDAVLLFEGSVAFASGAARRFGARQSVSAVPFTVRASPTGYAAAAEESSREEFWAPVWTRPAWFPDVAHMLREGRVEFEGSQATNGLDAAFALATLGVDRGIDEFVRYAFIERNGLATMAVPVDRIVVAANQSAALMAKVGDWVDRFRGDHLPTSAVRLVAAARQVMYTVAQADEDMARPMLLELLGLISELDALAARSQRLRDRVGRSPSGLFASAWLPALDDGSTEFHIAESLASLREPDRADGIIRRATHPAWEGRRAPVEGFGRRPLDAVLGDVISWWSHEPEVERFDREKLNNAWTGQVTASWCPPGSFSKLATGEVDLSRLESILAGLMMLDWRRVDRGRQDAPDPDSKGDLSRDLEVVADDVDVDVYEPMIEATCSTGVLWRVPAWVAMLKLCFHHRPAAAALRSGPLVATGPMARQVGSGRLVDALDGAVHRLRVAGLEPRLNVSHLRPDARVPVAALLLTPVSDAAIKVLAARTCNQPSSGDERRPEAES